MTNEKVEKPKMTKLYFPELNASMEVEIALLTKVRHADKRGYAVFPAVDSDGDDVAIASITPEHAVPIALLLNDTTIGIKGGKKNKKKILS